MKISTTHKGAAAPIVVEKNFGDSLGALVAQHGEEAIYKKALSSYVIEFQNFVRQLMVKGGKSVEEITAAAEAWKPGTKSPRTRKPAKDKFLESFATMSAEQQEELLAALQAKAAPVGKNKRAA